MSGTNSRTWVGLEPRRWMREHMSVIVDLTSLPSTKECTFDFSSLLRGVKNPFAAGRIIVACRNCSTTVRNDFNGTDLLRIKLCASLMYRRALSAGSLTVLFLPSNSMPIISFFDLKLPSPLLSFFSEMGSFPPSCVVTFVGGNTLWMP